MLLMPARPSTSSFSSSLTSLSLSTFTTMASPNSASSSFTTQAPPPTCNLLDAAQRTRLIKSTRKLEKVLGTTPYVLEEVSVTASRRPESRKGRGKNASTSTNAPSCVAPTPILASFSAIDLTASSPTSSPSNVVSRSNASEAPSSNTLRTRSLSRASIATFSSLSSFISAASSSTGAGTEIECHDPSSLRRTSLDSSLSCTASARPLVGTSTTSSSSIANAFLSPFNAFLPVAMTIPGSEREDSPRPPLLRLPQTARMGYNTLKAQKHSSPSEVVGPISEFGENSEAPSIAAEPEVDRDALSCALSGVTSPTSRRRFNSEDDADSTFTSPARSLDDIDVDRFPSRAKSRLGSYTYSLSDDEDNDSDCDEVDAELDEFMNPFCPSSKATTFDLRSQPRACSLDGPSRRERARKLEKLSRHLGENIPSELVFGPLSGPKTGSPLKRSVTGRTVSSVASYSPSTISTLNDNKSNSSHTTTSYATPNTSPKSSGQSRRSSVSIGICGPAPSSHALSSYGSSSGVVYGKRSGSVRMCSINSGSKVTKMSPTVAAKDMEEWDAAEYQDVVKRLRALRA